MNQRRMSQPQACCSVQNKAEVTNSLAGERTMTHRMGRGDCPGVYHNAVPVANSTRRGSPPYHFTSRFSQAVVVSVNRLDNDGWRFPFRGFGPRLLWG